MRVLLVISNLTFGGAERQVIEIANHLESTDVEMHVCILSDHAPLADRLSLPHRLHKIPKSHKYDLSVVIKLRRLIHELEISVVHGFLFDAEIASRLAGWGTSTAVIGSERNSEYRYGKLHYWVYRVTSGLVATCIANSRAGKNLNQKTFGQPDSYYKVIYNGVDLDRFAVREPDWKKCGLEQVEDKFVIGMVGSFKPQKNHHYLLDVVSELIKRRTDIVVLVAGTTIFEGDDESRLYYEEVKQRIEALGLGVYIQLVGAIEHTEDFYPLCHLTILTSKHEGTPNVALESLACGVPVIATNVADNAYVIPHGQVGYVAPIDDAASFSSLIDTLLSDREHHAQMKANARKWIEDEFSTDDMAKNFESAYRSASGRGQ